MRRRSTHKPLHYVLALLLALLVLALLFMVIGIVEKEETARKAAGQARRELGALLEREKTLEQNVNDLHTERGREASIRETYGVARPDEEVIIVVEPEAEEPLKELSWWDKFLGWLRI